jgi:hypothetical protein
MLRKEVRESEQKEEEERNVQDENLRSQEDQTEAVEHAGWDFGELSRASLKRRGDWR